MAFGIGRQQPLSARRGDVCDRRAKRGEAHRADVRPRRALDRQRTALRNDVRMHQRGWLSIVAIQLILALLLLPFLLLLPLAPLLPATMLALVMADACQRF